jgi:FAD/FMN-containing dehydrogenase
VRRKAALTLLAVVVLGAVLFGRAAVHLVWTAAHDRDEREAAPVGTVDDASRMNRTPVAEVWRMPAGPDGATRLRALLLRARTVHLPVALAGARHSMGGQTIAPGGIAVEMSGYHAIQVDRPGHLLHVQAGARWADVVEALDARGLSVEVMQSNDSFSVGGSLSVNCHGWQVGSPPIDSTVVGFTLMQADGTVVHVSRTVNPELFALALGGCGLFGVILDVDLRVVPNERYRVERAIVPSSAYVPTWEREVDQRVSQVAMAFGRLCIERECFLREAILTMFLREQGAVPALAPASVGGLRRALVRGEVDSEYGKHLRWQAERRLGETLTHQTFSRNQLLHEDVSVYQDRSRASTDILHEYFVPRAQLEPFLVRLRTFLPAPGIDLLNVTLRDVHRDEDSVLRYADQAMVALVFFFHQPRTVEADQRMQSLTRRLIEAALAVGGRYYLPYRLHATQEQFERAYPQARAFFRAQRRLDPDGIFQNRFLLQYGRGQGTGSRVSTY